jgi:multicomponent Na+:H+ antiporter subunit F
MTMDEFCLYGAAGVLAVAALLVLVRTVLGPTVYDRSIGLDVLTAICLAAISVDAAERHSGAFLPMLLLLSLVGFTGAVCIARFAGGGDGEEVSGEDGLVPGPADESLGDCLPAPLPETELEKRREEGL